MSADRNKPNLQRIIGRVAAVLSIAMALLWAVREMGLIQLERPDNLLVPALACGVIGLVLLRTGKGAKNE